MPKQVKSDVETFARIKVLGIGGSGKNALEHMIQSKVNGVEFIAINTDSQDLHKSSAKKKIHIGKNVTKGLGAGMNPEIGRRAAEETLEEIQEATKGADMVFVTCGLGGGTGSGAAPKIAQTAKEAGALTVAVATKPFFFEGKQRMAIAEKAIEDLRKSVDAIIIIPNDRLLGIIDKETTAKNAFAKCDAVLKQAVEGISDLITTPGIINVDFADIRSILMNAGPALMGIGQSTGEKRAEEAAKAAINSPLLDISISGAKGVLFSIAGGDDLTMFEIQEAAKIITESIDTDAKIIFGTVKDDNLKKGEVKVTVIASGFPEGAVKKSLFGSSSAMPNFGNSNKEEDRKEEKTEKKGIFNSVPKEKKEEEKPQEEQPAPATASNSEEDDDDWGAVPSFLRRSKLK